MVIDCLEDRRLGAEPDRPAGPCVKVSPTCVNGAVVELCRTEPGAPGARSGDTCEQERSFGLDELLRVVEVNLIAVMDLCRLATDLLHAAPAASVINVASVYGIVASRGPMAAYNATKAALINLTRHLAAVWVTVVRVNALAPGYFPTELTGFLADPAFAQSIRDRTLLGPPGDRRTRWPAAVPRHCRLQLHGAPRVWWRLDSPQMLWSGWPLSSTVPPHGGTTV